MNSALPPAVIFIVGAVFVPLFKGRVKQIYLLALSVLAGLDLLYLPNGQSWTTSLVFIDFLPRGSAKPGLWLCIRSDLIYRNDLFPACQRRHSINGCLGLYRWGLGCHFCR